MEFDLPILGATFAIDASNINTHYQNCATKLRLYN